MIDTLADLRSDARFLALGDSSNEDFSDADTLLYANEYTGLAMSILFGSGEKAMLYAEADEDTHNIQAGDNEITPDTDILSIGRVDIKYPSSASYKQAKFVSLRKAQKVGLDKYVVTNPEYTFFNSKLIIFVGNEKADIEAVDDGVKIYNYPNITELSAVGDEPNLVKWFRGYISAGMAMKYCVANEMWTKKKELENEMDKYEFKMRKFYSQFIKGENGMRVRRENYS